MKEEKRGRGRPATGNAKTPTERVQASEAAILAEGGQRLGTVRIGAEASRALDLLIDRYGSKKAAIEAALIAHAGIMVGSNGK